MTMIAGKNRSVPTVDQMVHDEIIQVVAEVYQKQLLKTNFALRQIMMLEFTQYLEFYLWPNYSGKESSLEHLISILVMVNEKFRERVPAWNAFKENPDEFESFFKRVLEAALQCDDLTLREQMIVVQFLDHCFSSVEVDLLRIHIQKLVSLPMWICLPMKIRDKIFMKNRKLRKYWKVIQKHDSKLSEEEKNEAEYQRRFLYRFICKFYRILSSIPAEGELI
ncbi:unnamed protein product [Soboliphyme baturini]|uniref:Aquarius_N domain-containing protein n=1 Tax=Soboliphyme baturini TaxID=241478 RepID=A0A183J0J2_9BILA|nr:unnamed protein product [Soboliphyme baturini]